MVKNDDILKESSQAVKEIGEHLEDTLAKKKEDAEKKLDQIRKEIDKRRESLTNFETQIAELEKHKADFEGKVTDHLDKAIQYKKEIEKLAESKLSELKKMDKLDQKIREHRQQAEEKTAELKQNLEEKYEVTPSAPENEAHEEKVKGSIEEELNKLRKVKELLGLAEVPQIKEEVGPEARTAEEISLEEGETEKEAPPEMLEAEEPGLKEEKEAEAIKEEVVSQAPPVDEGDSRDKLALLETLKKLETVGGEDKIMYYKGEKKTVIDGRCLFSAIDSRIQQARDLYQNLDPNSAPKDQFKIKQEIRNCQENLRKYFLKTIEMYEKESFLLPEYSSEVLNINILRDIMEHLSMLNWSEEENFSFFNDRIDKIKRSFYSKITPPDNYLVSIHEELSA